MDLNPSLEALGALQSQEGSQPEALLHDGLIPAPIEGFPKRWSPNNLAELANCPLRFFFGRILRARAIPEAPEPTEALPVEIGNSLHEALDILGQGEMKEPAAALATSQSFKALKKRLEELSPALAQAAEARLLRWLETFLEWDRRQQGERGLRALRTEKKMERKLGDMEIHGRADRLLELPDGRKVIQDLKTGGRIENHVDKASMLRGSRLQVPLYAWLAAREGEALPESEILALGPAAENRPESQWLAAAGGLEDVMDGILETVRVLVEEAARGQFPYAEEAPCSYCAFRPACRRGDPASDRRVLEGKIFEKFHLLGAKNTKAKLLRDLGA
jgi:RecB family exonuclease